MLVHPTILVHESEYVQFEQDKEKGLAGAWNFLCLLAALSPDTVCLWKGGCYCFAFLAVETEVLLWSDPAFGLRPT